MRRADSFQAHLVNDDDTLNMLALRPIQKGEEVLNDYGPLPRSDLLRRYGYLTPKYKQFDVVEIPHELLVRYVKEHAERLGWSAAGIEERVRGACPRLRATLTIPLARISRRKWSS